MDLTTRFLTPADSDRITELYREIAAHPGGFARAAEEVSIEYIDKILSGAQAQGIAIGAINKAKNQLIGFIVASKPGPKVFDHVLSDLTIGVHPSCQRKGVGRRLFLDFLEHVQRSRSDISRIELIVRESNQLSINFYETIGFRAEGRFEKRILNENGAFEDDIPMAWLKPE